jgi:hypothetical protein
MHVTGECDGIVVRYALPWKAVQPHCMSARSAVPDRAYTYVLVSVA